jgi:F0F1-type ATP synthase epsilon subunit
MRVRSAPDRDAAPTRWLLVNLAAGDSAAATLDAWRRLRALGAHYLQPAVCLLPERPETRSALERIAVRVRRAGGHARVFPIGLLNQDDERAVIAAFSAERSDEYDEVVSRANEFLAEIAMERERRRFTYTEFEESDVDLKRFRRWLASIRRRDYFDAPGYADALAAVTTCEDLLAEFEAEAFSVEVHPTEDDLDRAPWRLRLRALGGGGAG